MALVKYYHAAFAASRFTILWKGILMRFARRVPRPSRFVTGLTFAIALATVLVVVFFQTLILPFIEHQELFKQFHLDEPWNSAHNLALIEFMPDVYCDPNFDMPGRTMYLQPVGKGALFGKGKNDNGRGLTEIAGWTTKDGKMLGWTKQLNYQDVSDPAATTIMLIEADPERAVIWTKPDDFEFDLESPLAGLGHATPGGFHVRFVDGAVEFLPHDIEPERLRLLFDPDDGRQVEPGK